MSFRYEISKRLSREHQDVIALLARFGTYLNTVGLSGMPNWTDYETKKLLSDLRVVLETEIPNHFAIEEAELFPLLAEEGFGQMINILLADHRVILDLVKDIKPIVDNALTNPSAVTTKDWQILYSKGKAFVTELSTHASKEECGFVPAVDEVLDEDQAGKILVNYQGM